VAHYKLFFKINDHLVHLRVNSNTQLVALTLGLPQLVLLQYQQFLLVVAVVAVVVVMLAVAVLDWLTKIITPLFPAQATQ
jgi:hypothetical protein